MKNHEEFEKRIKGSLNMMEAKISYLNDGVKGLAEAFKEFESEISDFMAFTAENYADHEKRISDLEKKFN
jgi:DNA helicase IV